MPTYLVTLYGGRQGLTEADSLRQAKATARVEEGVRNLKSVVKATDEDIRWTVGMGGWAPKKDLERLGLSK